MAVGVFSAAGLTVGVVGWRAGQEAVLLRERADQAGVIGRAAGPLLLRLRQARPRQQQHVGERSAHQHVGLGKKHTHTQMYVYKRYVSHHYKTSSFKRTVNRSTLP